MNESMYIYNKGLKLEILSPTIIGGDQTDQLYPLVDYIIEGNHAFKINKSLLFENLAATNSIEDLQDFTSDWVNNIIENRIDSSPWIKGLIEGAGLSQEHLLLEIPLGEEKLSEHFLSVKNICTTAGDAYIPGSTLKGAIISALLFKYLLENREGIEWFKNIINQLRVLVSKYQEILKNDSGQIRKQIKEFNKNEFSPWNKKIENKYHNAFNGIFCFNIDSGVPMFPNKKFNNDEKPKTYNLKFNANLLRISDSASVNRSHIKLYEQLRYNMKELDEKPIPMATLAIEPSHEKIVFNLQIGNEIKKNINSDIFSNISKDAWGGIKDVLNNWSLLCVEADLNLCSLGKKHNAQWLEKYIKQLEEYKILIEVNRKTAATFRIGQGKGWIYTTLAPLINKFDPELYYNFCQMTFNTDSDITPITRVLTYQYQTMMGWVSVTE